jgi:16S rRNA (uracil1498-N3)-methyltransferase
MPQYLISDEKIAKDGSFVLEGAEARHLIRVLRAREGGQIRLFNGKGRAYMAEITGVNRDSLEGKIVSELPLREKNALLRLYASQIKIDRFEVLLEKATETGADELIPLVTERTIIKGSPGAHKIARWRNIIISAAKQSCREVIPGLLEPVDFGEALDGLRKEDINLIAHPGDNNKGLLEVLKTAGNAGTINLFIGPEGGFSPRELGLAKERGLTQFSLGNSTLRTETAAIVACGLIEAYFAGK